jgi:hypothetical protein
VHLQELKQALAAADPSVVLVAPRILRRVLQKEFRVPYLLVEAPHEHGYAFDRQVLFRWVEQEELDVEPDCLLPPTVILLARPQAEELEALERDEALLKYWQLLFHVHVHLTLQRRYQQGLVTAADVRTRIEHIGRAEFEEIHTVLKQEHYLLPPEDDVNVYIEFAAVYLELRYFRSNLRSTYFPALADFQAIDRLLAQDIDADALFARTRLPGAPDPVIRTDTSSDESHDYYYRLLRHADRAGNEGDRVRAGILRTRAARVAPAELTLTTRSGAVRELEQLTLQLQQVLKFDDATSQEWRQVLPALLDKADQGSWPVEAKLLYDLQKACSDHDRKLYALDVVEWVLSGGKRPIKRPLSSLQLVRVTKDLRSAAQRLTLARISDDDRKRLAKLLQSGLEQCQERLRERFRPVLRDAFHDVGLDAASPPEQVALAKMIEELLDRITENGFFTFADLRDTLSRNQLKLPDLSDPYSYWRGDPLLCLDRRLSALMEGVYRHGEFYLRWLESCSSLFFGTAVGRFLTLNLIVPFGGAFALLKGLEVLWPTYGEKALEEVGAESAAEAVPFGFPWYAYLLVGLFLLCLIRFRPLRSFLAQALHASYRGLRFAFVEVPRRLWKLPWVHGIFQSWPFLLLYWYVLKPLILTSAVWLYLPWTRSAPVDGGAVFSPLRAGLTFLVMNLVLNSRPGKAASETITEALVLVYGWLRFDMLRGLFRLVNRFFKQVSRTLEYILYSVDERLRFRSDESRITMVMRGVLGALWFPIRYLIRFYFVMLLEPTLNPIKLPLSSLAFKFMLFIPLYQQALLPGGHEERLAPFLGWPVAIAVTLAVIIPTLWLLPGVCAFFIWEMQENWRLFRANRSPRLKPVVVGRHGETMTQLLKPGFHSGTIPRLFASLRQAERNAYLTGDWRPARAHRLALREVARSIQVFIEREFIGLLRQSKSWAEVATAVGQIALSCNRIRVELCREGSPQQPAWLIFEERSGWLVGSLQQAGWLSRLADEPREVVTSALIGLYKIAGVDLVREQLMAAVCAPLSEYYISDHKLVLERDQGQGAELVYDLSDQNRELRPSCEDGTPPPVPALEARQLFFSRIPLTWDEWVECWRKDHAGQGHPRLLQDGMAQLTFIPRASVKVGQASQPDAATAAASGSKA